jgi:mycothiol maleylpyruvate isomerase-like protein
MQTDRLIDDLGRARDGFFEVLARVEPASMTTPGLIGDWSARELIAHLGYWVGHATEAIHAVEQGRAEDVGVGEPPVDDVNATVARVAVGTSFATVRRREAASVEALVERLRSVDPRLLGEVLPGGATLEDHVREDGPDHYREHADGLSAVLGERAHG